MSRLVREAFPGTYRSGLVRSTLSRVNPVLALAAATLAVLVGVLVLRAHQTRIGWLLVVHGVSFGALLTFSAPATGGATLAVDQVASGSWVFLFVWLAVIAYLLPDGHTASRVWRRWVIGGLIGVLLFLVGAAGDAEGFRADHEGADPPLPWLPGPVSGVLGMLGLIATYALLIGSVFAVRSRLRGAAGDERLQLLWLVWGATSLPVALALVWVGYVGFGDNAVVVDAAVLLAGTALPVTIGIAILRHRLFDIQLVLSRTLVYGVLVAAVVAVYALLLLAAERLGGSDSVAGLLAVAIVAVAIHPAYEILRQGIERWVYGYRSDPAAAMRRLGAEAEAADPLRLVDSITWAIADALKVSHVWVEDPAGEPLDTEPHSGLGARATLRVPLIHRGSRIGDLAVEVPPGRTLSSADRGLLEDLARQSAVTVRAAQLAAELQASRSRIVTAREEERRRLRRDLHDGLGPSLAAIVLKVRAAQGRSNAEERNAILEEVLDETKAAIAEVRRVVDDLRPPALDEVGLVAAIRQRAATLSTPTLTVEVDGPEQLPPLPAAVEVAAFRIVSEAMTNAARHSGATRCVADLQLGDSLVVSVSDNGVGGAQPSPGGVGWFSMIERAAELGGSYTMTDRAQGGLLVRAALPLVDHAGAEAIG